MTGRILIAAPDPTAARAVAASFGCSVLEQSKVRCLNSVGDLKIDYNKHTDRPVIWCYEASDPAVLKLAADFGYPVKPASVHPSLDWCERMKDGASIYCLGHMPVIRFAIRDDWRLPSQFEKRVKLVTRAEHIAGVGRGKTLWLFPNYISIPHNVGDILDYARAGGFKVLNHTQHPLYEPR